MKKKEVISNLEYLVKKYTPEKSYLIDIAITDTDGVKYVLAELSKNKNKEYDKQDIEIIKDIGFYYI